MCSKAALATGGGSRLPQALKLCRDAMEIKKTAELVKLEEEIQAAIKKQLKKQDNKEEVSTKKRRFLPPFFLFFSTLLLRFEMTKMSAQSCFETR